MRTSLTALLLAGFAAAGLCAAVPGASAADLSLQGKVVAHHKRVSIHVRSRIVRDLDGTPIILRRVRSVALADDGSALLAKPVYEAIAVKKPQPNRYLNGEPVR